MGDRREVDVVKPAGDEDWVLLAYRLPREPSTPRSSVWRKLKRLGVAQLGDGLVALPADARTREQLEWVAEEVVDHGGEATLWMGPPLGPAAAAALAARMAAAIGEEYRALVTEAHAALTSDAAGQRRTLLRLRRQVRAIRQRDFFPPPDADAAGIALDRLARAIDPSEVSA